MISIGKFMESMIRITLLCLLLTNSTVFSQFGDRTILSIEAFKSLDYARPGSEIKAAIKVNIEDKWHINSNKPNEEFLIPTVLLVSSDAGIESKNILYPSPKEILLGFSETPVSVYEGTIYIGVLLKIPNKIKNGEYKVKITLSYQGCDDATCLPPNTAETYLNISIDGSKKSNEINSNIFNKIKIDYSKEYYAASDAKNEVIEVYENEEITIDSSIIQIQQFEENEKEQELGIVSILESSGIIFTLAMAFIWGLALNLTPCVYPLIPITIGYFGGQSEGKTSKLFFLGILYVLGIAFTYSIVGVATALSGSILGALLQNTYIIIIIALIFVGLSASMFGLYEFKLPDSLVQKTGGAKSGILGAFFMGLTMGIVAAPCIGPVILGLITFVAAKGDVFFGFIIFFFLAMGLGLPYLLLAIFSGKIKTLPRAGLWMEGVKRIFGVLLLAMAIYFLLPLIPKGIASYTLPGYGIIASLYLLFFNKTGNKVKGFYVVKLFLTISTIIISFYFIYPKEQITVEWQSFTNEEFERSQGNNERIILDFYADWCIPCKELDAVTFSNKKVIEKLRSFSRYKVDLTKSISKETAEIIKIFAIKGVPTIIVYGSDGIEKERITGFISANNLIEKLEKIK